jgi:hypothetical protein
MILAPGRFSQKEACPAFQLYQTLEIGYIKGTQLYRPHIESQKETGMHAH